LLLLLFAGLLAGHAAEKPEDAPTDVPSIHDRNLAGLAVEIRAMYLREDHESIRPALGKLELACRRLNAEDKLVYGEQFVSFDLGLHRALDRTRELAADGMWTESEGQYEWVLRTCTRCHQTARDEGIGPPLPLPLTLRSSSPGGSGSPSRSTASKPWR
jgi:hypothetical protein